MNWKILLVILIGMSSLTVNAQTYSKDQVDFKFTNSYPVFDIYQQEFRDIEGRKEITWFNDFVEKMRVGGDFWLAFQGMYSRNPEEGYFDAHPGFTNARGNVFLDLEASKGVTSYFEIYLSSEHHLDVWMREGYLFLDDLPAYQSEFIEKFFEVFSFKAGQMEINFGDWHLRRTDNGQAQRNPLVGNYLIDANTTEIGLEVLMDFMDFQFLGAFTGGTTKEDLKFESGFGWYFKLAWDKKIQADWRMRISGSYYSTNHQTGNTKSYLYSGNRSGSPYRNLFGSSTDAGQILPNTTQKVGAYQFNILAQCGDLELFVTIDGVQDRAPIIPNPDPNAPTQLSKHREMWVQYAIDGVYKLNKEFYLALRYNQTNRLAAYDGSNPNNRAFMWNAGLGYWLKGTPALLKVEYMNQQFRNFDAEDDYANYAQFGDQGTAQGFVFEGSLTF